MSGVKDWWGHAPDLTNITSGSPGIDDKSKTNQTIEISRHKDAANVSQEIKVAKGNKNGKSSPCSEVTAEDETKSDGSSSTASSIDNLVPIIKKASEPLIFCGNIVHSTEQFPLLILHNQVLGVKDGKIIFLHSATVLPQLLEEYNQDEDSVYFLRDGSFLMPGFVDAQVHVSQYGMAGKAMQMDPVEWLSLHKTSSRRHMQNDNYVRKLARHAVKRALSNGTTCAAYYCSAQESVTRVFATVVDKLHQRAVLGLDLHLFQGADDMHMLQIAKAEDVIQYIKSKNNPLLIPSLTTMLPFQDHIESLIRDAQQKHGVLLQMNVTESDTTRQYLQRWMHLTESQIKHHHSNGLLTDKTILAHCTNCSDEDYDLIQQTGASVVHCPNSNIALMRGTCDVQKLIEKKIKVGLGTDMAAGYSTSMLDTIRQCVQVSKMLKLSKTEMNSIRLSLTQMMKQFRDSCRETVSDLKEANERLQHLDIQKHQKADADVSYLPYHCIDYKEAFRLATIGGAEALNLADKIGNFEVGKYFDALIVDPFVANSPFDVFHEEDSIADIVEKFICIGDDRNITHVFVAGTRVK